MRRHLKDFSVLILTAMLLMFTLFVGITGHEADFPANYSIGRLARKPVILGSMLLLIAISMAAVLLSKENRREQKIFFGGIFVGIGFALSFGLDPSLGLMLVTAGSVLASARSSAAN
jgi:uncharacterized BrkB/YihY/UPF0761 family membrane protein